MAPDWAYDDGVRRFSVRACGDGFEVAIDDADFSMSSAVLPDTALDSLARALVGAGYGTVPTWRALEPAPSEVLVEWVQERGGLPPKSTRAQGVKG